MPTPVNEDEFAIFWAQYPRRVAKLAAKKAFVKARKTVALQEILDGIDRYIASKPSYADYCFPASFLNQGRWMDEDAKPVTRPAVTGSTCLHRPRCRTNGECIQRVLDEGRRERGR